MKCLILGGGGFLGSHIAEALLLEGHEVRIFDRPNLVTASLFSGRDNIEWVEGDFTNEEDLGRVVPGCDIIFHLVSTTLPQSSNDNPIYDVDTNLIGTLRLLNIARAESVKRILFISSGGTVYGIPKKVPIAENHPTDPLTSYGITKLAIEKYLKLYKTLYGLNYKVLRVANPYGERQRVNATQGAIAVFLNKALQGTPIQIWGDGSVARDYIYVKDVVDAFLRVMVYEGEHDIFNIGSGISRTLNEVIAAIEEVTGQKITRNYISSRKFDVPVNVLDIALARTELGWRPKTSFFEGIYNTLAWLKSADIQHPS